MRNRLLGFSLLCLFFAPSWAQAAGTCERLVATGNPEYPPYLWRDPQNPKLLIGANADLLKQIGEELGVKVEVLYTGTWARAQKEVSSGRVDMLAGAFLTVPRLEVMDYVHPAFYNTTSVVWVQTGKGFEYLGPEDLREQVGGTVLNNSFGQSFDSFARANLKLEEVPSLTQAFKKLLLGRTNYVLYELYPGLTIAEQLGIKNQLEVLQPPISSEGLHFTLSHNSACNDPWLRGQLAKKMTELQESGAAEQLLERNLDLWREQHVAKVGAANEVEDKQ